MPLDAPRLLGEGRPDTDGLPKDPEAPVGDDGLCDIPIPVGIDELPGGAAMPEGFSVGAVDEEMAVVGLDETFAVPEGLVLPKAEDDLTAVGLDEKFNALEGLLVPTWLMTLRDGRPVALDMALEASLVLAKPEGVMLSMTVSDGRPVTLDIALEALLVLGSPEGNRLLMMVRVGRPVTDGIGLRILGMSLTADELTSVGAGRVIVISGLELVGSLITDVLTSGRPGRVNVITSPEPGSLKIDVLTAVGAGRVTVVSSGAELVGSTTADELTSVEAGRVTVNSGLELDDSLTETAAVLVTSGTTVLWEQLVSRKCIPSSRRWKVPGSLGRGDGARGAHCRGRQRGSDGGTLLNSCCIHRVSTLVGQTGTGAANTRACSWDIWPGSRGASPLATALSR